MIVMKKFYVCLVVALLSVTKCESRKLPALVEVDGKWDGPRVTMHVGSQTNALPVFRWLRYMPSGLLPSSRKIALDSTTDGGKLSFVTREEWGAREPTEITFLTRPVPMVVIHHSSKPTACYTTDECKRAMRSMQDNHQFEKQWADIGYNFAVGGDGLVYEGRSWDKMGAHAIHFNNISIGIVLIGYWATELPPENQLRATKRLIDFGVASGYVDSQYKLVGHRQLKTTKCPGDALFNEIETWSHYEPTPHV